jgi:hypothetical protein
MTGGVELFLAGAVDDRRYASVVVDTTEVTAMRISPKVAYRDSIVILDARVRR